MGIARYSWTASSIKPLIDKRLSCSSRVAVSRWSLYRVPYRAISELPTGPIERVMLLRFRVNILCILLA